MDSCFVLITGTCQRGVANLNDACRDFGTISDTLYALVTRITRATSRVPGNMMPKVSLWCLAKKNVDGCFYTTFPGSFNVDTTMQVISVGTFTKILVKQFIPPFLSSSVEF